MTLELTDFGAYFRALNDDRPPFAWQERLLEHLVTHRQWPDQIDAPTGAGKSAAIDIHTFATALTLHDPEPLRRLPRRLVVTVDRRALVDSHEQRASRIAARLRDALRDADAPPALRAVATMLRSLWTEPLDVHVSPNGDWSPLGVVRLRGGTVASSSWLDSPSTCQVIAATPDMWGSRLLFNGYGSTTFAHPREAGLLAIDSVIVLDEAHLNRQLLTTARRVAELVGPDAARLGLPPLQVTAMTATQDTAQLTSVGVLESDLEREPILQARLTRPKPVRLRTSEGWAGTGKGLKDLADAVVAEVLAARAAAGATVGCVVNNVRLATEVRDRLARLTVPETASERAREPLEVMQIVGRMRPWDLERLRADHPLLFTHGGDPGVDVLVATQTVEVGVDMDFAALVTTLAPGSAIAQRAGRTNRSGTRASGPVTVIVPPDITRVKDADVAPYRAEDLSLAHGWLERRAESPAGLAPWAIRGSAAGDPAPTASERRIALHRVEPWNVSLWARTSDALFADHDLELWLSDDLSEDLSAGVIVRHGLPEDIVSAARLLEATPPQPHELFPVRLGEARAVVRASTDVTAPKLRRLFVIRRGEVTGYESTRFDEVRLRPEDVVVVDADAAIFRSAVVDSDGNETAEDVSERATAQSPARRSVRVHRGAPVTGGPVGEALVGDLIRFLVGSPDGGDGVSAKNGDVDRDGIIELLRGWSAQVAGEVGTARAAFARDSADLLRQILDDAHAVDVVVERGGESGGEPWVVVTGVASRLLDEDVRQTWTAARGRVSLDAHAAAVAGAAAALGTTLGLAPSLTGALEQAGRLHDEGKRDRRFQRSLRNSADDHPDEVLAKSGMRSLQRIRRARSESALPAGWRHEQLSAAVAWSTLEAATPPQRDLVVRLVGTSHGRGRGGFVHTGNELVPEGAATSVTDELFNYAEWELLVERTHMEWGAWGCAYLESLLRAADGNVSRSGS